MSNTNSNQLTNVEYVLRMFERVKDDKIYFVFIFNFQLKHTVFTLYDVNTREFWSSRSNRSTTKYDARCMKSCIIVLFRTFFRMIQFWAYWKLIMCDMLFGYWWINPQTIVWRKLINFCSVLRSALSSALSSKKITRLFAIMINLLHFQNTLKHLKISVCEIWMKNLVKY